MKTVENYIFIALILLNVLIIYLPRLIIKQKHTITGQALKELYPHLSWVRWAFFPLYFAWIGFVFLLVFLYGAIFGEYHWFVSPVNALAAVGLFFGIFALLTKVIVVPYRMKLPRYATGTKANKAIKIQLSVAVGAIIVNSIIQFILTR